MIAQWGEKWGQTVLSTGVRVRSASIEERGALGQNGQSPFFAHLRVAQPKLRSVARCFSYGAAVGAALEPASVDHDRFDARDYYAGGVIHFEATLF